MRFLRVGVIHETQVFSVKCLRVEFLATFFSTRAMTFFGGEEKRVLGGGWLDDVMIWFPTI